MNKYSCANKNTHCIVCLSDYIPEFTDIEKTSANFLKESTIGSIMFGNSNKYKEKTKLYTSPIYPGFVRVENVDNHKEFIFAYDEDRNLLKEGMYRYSWPSGETALGNRLFGRDGRDENRAFRLTRFSSGNIYYYDRISETPGTGWKTLVKYKFNNDNLTWTKQT